MKSGKRALAGLLCAVMLFSAPAMHHVVAAETTGEYSAQGQKVTKKGYINRRNRSRRYYYRRDREQSGCNSCGNRD